MYKFISFDENIKLNLNKLSCLKQGQLWFSYYRFLNDETEFDMKYDVNKVSDTTGIPIDNINFFISTIKEVYDVCSLTYSYNSYMWETYGNSGNGICLEFNVSDYDMLYPIR